ncbi:MAG: thiamine pyrophosphate-binding protein [Gammaproteobacteria bacterium]|nr:thiamine pyrophosphate-binding protein [Gammaproteobacteria bacterium]
MSQNPSLRSGAELLIDALRLNSVERIFCIPGESYLAALDALHDRGEIDLVVCRNEGGAAYMAEADGKLSGRPGVCFVTRGPGASNASGGLHVAMQDSTPLILLIGQVARRDAEREAFQEIDYRRMFGQVTKWTAQIEDADRVPEYVNRAFSVATGGRPGPVALALPEDMLTDSSEAADAGAWQPLQTSPSQADIATAMEMLNAAERPLIIIGGSGWSDATRERLQAFAAAHQLPVVNSFRCQDYFDNDHPNYVGDLGLGVNPGLADAVRQSDCLLVIGARLGEMTTGGYSLIDIPRPRQKLIHVFPAAEELGHVYQVDLGIVAHAARFVEMLAGSQPATAPGRMHRLTALRTQYVDWNRSIVVDGDLQLAEVFHQLRSRLRDDAIVCNGAGNNTGWLHRFFRYRRYPNQLAPTSGTMGYGLPAAIAARLRHPERQVVAIAGDGDLMMNLQELATAMQYGVAVIVILVNNGTYATIRMHQEREYPGRVIGTDMINPDFVTLAEAHGAHAERVTATADFAPALERALASERLALIEIRVDANLLTPTLTIEGLRARER